MLVEVPKSYDLSKNDTTVHDQHIVNCQIIVHALLGDVAGKLNMSDSVE